MINVNNKTKFLFVMFATILGVYLSFRYILPLLVPFLFAYFFAWVLSPVVKFLEKRFHIPRMLGGILSVATLGVGVLWVICSVGHLLLGQIVIFLRNMPIYLSAAGSQIDKFCTGCDKFFGYKVGSAKTFIDQTSSSIINTIKTSIIPAITSHSMTIAIGVVSVIGVILIVVIAILLIVKDEEEYKTNFKKIPFYSDIHVVTSKLSDTGIAYLRTQGIMMIIIAVLCSAGLLLLKNKYALLIGIGIGIFDAFPVLGSGLILVPWSIISIFNKDIYSAAVLMTLYFACQITRQCLEPKLLGNRIGIRPIFTLMAMYIGIRLFGFAGFFLGPIALVIIVTILKESENRLLIK